MTELRSETVARRYRAERRFRFYGAAALALTAGSARASTSAQYGVQDDAWLLYGATAAALIAISAALLAKAPAGRG